MLYKLAILAAGLACASTIAASTSSAPSFEQAFELNRFFRGNTHAHSLRSDGDSPPEQVIEWYRSQGYNFLALTDHNRASQIGEFAALETETFKMLAGEEVSYASDAPPGFFRPYQSTHLCSLCSTRTIGGKKINPISAALKHALDQILSQPGAIAQINHPNYEWALTAQDILSAPPAQLIEISNMHPFVDNAGDAKHPDVETIWDTVLSNGRRIYGMATDDLHDLVSNPEFPPRRGGLGWVQVASEELTDRSICDALKAGKFYASTGVDVQNIRVDETHLSLSLAAGRFYRTEFIGAHGRVLSVVSSNTPSYELKGGEGYVRARVTDLGNPKAKAWIQPQFVKE